MSNAATEALRILRDLIADMPARADGNINALDLYKALDRAVTMREDDAEDE